MRRYLKFLLVVLLLRSLPVFANCEAPNCDAIFPEMVELIRKRDLGALSKWERRRLDNLGLVYSMSHRPPYREPIPCRNFVGHESRRPGRSTEQSSVERKIGQLESEIAVSGREYHRLKSNHRVLEAEKSSLQAELTAANAQGDHNSSRLIQLEKDLGDTTTLTEELRRQGALPASYHGRQPNSQSSSFGSDLGNPMTATESWSSSSNVLDAVDSSFNPLQEAACFVAGTKVLVPDKGDKFNFRAIELLREGDKVLSWDEATRQCRTSRVLYAHPPRYVHRLIVIKLKDELILTTDNHPFFVAELDKWLTAGHLLQKFEAGESHSVRSHDNMTWKIDAIAAYDLKAPVPVYNVEVARYHNYFVSSAGVLVHNCNRVPEGGPLALGGAAKLAEQEVRDVMLRLIEGGAVETEVAVGLLSRVSRFLPWIGTLVLALESDTVGDATLPVDPRAPATGAEPSRVSRHVNGETVVGKGEVERSDSLGSDNSNSVVKPPSGSGRNLTQDLLNIKQQKGLGDIAAGTRAEAEVLGKAWVNGKDARRFELGDGAYGLTDGIRTFRLQFKPKTGNWKANFQENAIPHGQKPVEFKNIHMTITNM